MIIYGTYNGDATILSNSKVRVRVGAPDAHRSVGSTVKYIVGIVVSVLITVLPEMTTTKGRRTEVLFPLRDASTKLLFMYTLLVLVRYRI